MKWTSKKNKSTPDVDEDTLVTNTSNLSLQPHESTALVSPDKPDSVPIELPHTSHSTIECERLTISEPSLLPPYSPPTDLTTDPPPYSPPHSTSPSPTPSKSSKPPNSFTKRMNSMKSAVEDGRATSFAKAACSGGMRAQKSFFKAEAVTQAVKTGNVPLVAFNAARAVYKGGKEASKTWKEAEKGRIEKLEKEGKVGGKEGVVFVEGECVEWLVEGDKGKGEKKKEKKKVKESKGKNK